VEENGSSGGAKDSGGSVNDAGDGHPDLAPLPDLPLEPEPSAEPSAGSRTRKWTVAAANSGAGPSKEAPGTPVRQILLGIMTTEKKRNGEGMKVLNKQLVQCGAFQIVEYSEEIFAKDVSEWPKCEALITIVAKGFPLEKALEFVKIHKPIEINKLSAVSVLLDRRRVYNRLKAWGLPHSKFIAVDHLDPDHAAEFVEKEDYVVFKGVQMRKPFVEKPADADRHDIWIYYPRNLGGGCKQLFRKVDNKSSQFEKGLTYVRRDGCYTYEPFHNTQGTDVKVYTVGTEYFHAEARKAPTVDGKVIRSKDGKEVRYPIILSENEKTVATLLVKAFEQSVCGFDILRTKGGSVVCDVNGWSFVKGNKKYYRDACQLIIRMFTEAAGIPTPLQSGEEVDMETFNATFADFDEIHNDLTLPLE
jgi:hypothetical protein